MDYVSFVREVERGRVPLIALLHGPEPLLLEEALTRVSRACFPDPSLIPLNREAFDARETESEAIVRSALTLPFLAPVRLVVVKECQVLPAKAGAPLAEYAQAPNTETRLMLLASAVLPVTHWLLKIVPPAAAVHAKSPTGRELVIWLKRRAGSVGLEVSDEAVQLLIQCVGEDLLALAGELEKAGLAGGPNTRRVGIEEVRAVVGEHRVRSIFELTRALERRAVGQALAVLEALLASGEEPLAVLGMLTREVRLTWLAKEWVRAGRSVDEMVRLLRRPPQAAETFLAHAEACSAAVLARQLSRCWEVERRLKTGGLPRPELTALVAELCAAG